MASQPTHDKLPQLAYARMGPCASMHAVLTRAMVRRALVGLLMYASPVVLAADTQLIQVQPGQNTDVYFEINVSGKVYLAIHAPSGGEACASFWWIKWPFGATESLGWQCNSASFDVPGITSLALSAKLRVGGAKQPLKIVVAANQQVAHSATVTFP